MPFYYPISQILPSAADMNPGGSTYSLHEEVMIDSPVSCSFGN